MTVISFPHHQAVFQPFGHYVRLGEGSFRKVADLAASRVLRNQRFVVEPSWLPRNKGLVRMLHGLGAELVLDPRTIELSSQRNCSGKTLKVPWAAHSPLTPGVFAPDHRDDIYGQIARCAVEGDVDVVIAPTHFLSDPGFDGWYEIDIEGCHQLRRALDVAGGFMIRIDFMIAARLQDLENPAFQAKVMTDLPNLPIDNLWVRASMSSPDDGPTNAQRLVRMLAGWHNAGVPIVMDYMAGITGEALLAMNVVSAIAHGFGEQTTFNTGKWTEPPEERDTDKPIRRGTRISLTALGVTLTGAEMEVVLSAHGAKSLLLTTDKKILPNGLDDIRKDPRAFNAAETNRRLNEIAAVPTSSRPEQFCKTRLREIVETRRKAAKLKPKDSIAKERKVNLEALTKRWATKAVTAEKLRGAYEDIAKERTDQGAVVKQLGPLRTHRPDPNASAGTA